MFIVLKCIVVKDVKNFVMVHVIVNLQKEIRGIKKVDSVIINGYQLYHNYVRPHMALGNMTPADKAEIIIEGDNKWKTIIENASKK